MSAPVFPNPPVLKLRLQTSISSSSTDDIANEPALLLKIERTRWPSDFDRIAHQEIFARSLRALDVGARETPRGTARSFASVAQTSCHVHKRNTVLLEHALGTR